MSNILCKLGIHSYKQYVDLHLEQKLNGYKVNGQQIYMDLKICRCKKCDKETDRTTNFYTADIMSVPIYDGSVTINNLVNKTPTWVY